MSADVDNEEIKDETYLQKIMISKNLRRTLLTIRDEI